MLANDSSFWRYKVYEDIRGGSLHGEGVSNNGGVFNVFTEYFS